MKILYTTLYSTEYGMGGAEKVLYDLARAMKEVFHDEVICVTNRGLLTVFLREVGISVAEVPRPKIETLRILWKLHETISSFRPDVVHSHHRYMTFLLTNFFNKRCKILHTQHIPMHDRQKLFRYGHLATAVHEAVRQNLIQHYKVPQDRVVTIPNAVAPQIPDPKELETLRRQYPRSNNQRYALCIARLEEQKGHRYLIEAVSQMPPLYQRRLKIFLAGDGTLSIPLKQEIGRRQLSEGFVFLGHTKRVAEFLALCDFLILPSLWEGLPLSVLEAYSAGRPVIATDIPGSRESVKPNETGVLIPGENAGALSKAIVYFIDHPSDVEEMGRRAYEFWKERFSFRKMITAYHELYGKMSTCE